MMPLRRRLDELPTIGPGMTLLLQRWSLKQSLAWSNEWRCLTMAETKTMYWNFSTSTFQTTHPCPSRQQLPNTVTPEAVAPPDVAFTIHHDCSHSASGQDSSPSMIPATFPTWIPGRGQLSLSSSFLCLSLCPGWSLSLFWSLSLSCLCSYP
jgi:hypothetical protein